MKIKDAFNNKYRFIADEVIIIMKGIFGNDIPAKIEDNIANELKFHFRDPNLTIDQLKRYLLQYFDQFHKDYDKVLKNKKIIDKNYVDKFFQKNNDKLIGKKVDDKFFQENLFEEIHKELDKNHKEDHKAKIGLFIIRATAELKNPSDRCSAALKADSSAGKDNIIKNTLKQFPEEDSFLLTRGTQSALEEESSKAKCVAFSEINKHREKGANSELTEIFKQLSEGGVFVIKRDKKTNDVIRLKTEQKTLLYGTTETESDEELETRYVIFPIKGSFKKNKIVVDDHLLKLRSKDFIFKKKNESWISSSIKNLDHNVEVIIPYTEIFEKKFTDADNKEKYIFDYSKERVKRDVKRIFSLTKAVTWLFQKQRYIEDYKGIKLIYSEPEDFLLILDIFAEFMNSTYEGFDPRYIQILEAIKKHSGKSINEIKNRGFEEKYQKLAINEEVWKETGLNKETFKKRTQWLINEGYVNRIWKPEVDRTISLLEVGMEVGKRSVLGVPIPTCTHLLHTWNTDLIRKEVYKGKEKIGKSLLNFDKLSTLSEKIPRYEIPRSKKDNKDEILFLISSKSKTSFDDILSKCKLDHLILNKIINKLKIDGDIFEPVSGSYQRL